MPAPVAIVGAGIGGLVLARVLHVHGIAATVYESEPDVGARTQGGQLDIHEEDGQVALREAGLTDAFRAIIHQGAEALRVLDQHGSVLLEQPDDGQGRRPEVLRGDLRRLLLESLPEDTVHWGRKVARVESLGAGRHELTFVDGATVRTEVLVGADGAWSKVRPLVSDSTPEYVGVTIVETYLYDVDERHPATAEAVGAGSMLAPAPGKWIAAHREAGGVLHSYVALKRPTQWFAAIDFTDAAAARARIAAQFDDWAPELTALITDCDTAPVARPLYALPDGHRWERRPGVTLIGDAAHLAPPAGEGANLAMFDGAQLGKSIAAHPNDIESALSAHEESMFPRGAASAAESRATLQFCLGEQSPHWLVDFLSGQSDGPSNPVSSTR
jgi:2-polyprenyl-6-methoxyphenol hydroxylase-like FAD-dependent oxidoreductase